MQTLMRLTRRHRILTVGLLLMLATLALYSFAEYYTSATAAERATARYDYQVTYNRITDLDRLIDELAYYQFGGLPPLPGIEAWDHSVGTYPVDWDTFPEEMTKNLIGYWEGNVPVYDLYIYQDNQTREIVFLNSDEQEIYSIECPYGDYCDPAAYALYRRPDLYSGNYTQEEIDYYIAHIDPARVGLWVKLVPTENLYEYLYAQAQEESFLQAMMTESGGGGGGQMMMSQGGGSGPLNDLDGDGVPNRDEIMAGTDPEDSGEYFHITSMERGTANTTLLITWPGVTNREYSVENMYGGTALLGEQNWGVLSQWLAGVDADITFTQDVSSSTVTTGFYRVQVRETDSDGDGLADWWEIANFGGLTNVTASGDEEPDGLDNLEELYYGYDPQESERDLYHSIFSVVEVSTNTPTGIDEGTECFDLHGGGRPLSLASNATDVNYAWIYADASSGGIYFNNDQSNLYIGVSGMHLGGNNVFAMFIDSGTGGVTNLQHLSTAPQGFGTAANIHFDATEFTPNVGLLLGSRFVDGSNAPNHSIGGNAAGQGVYNLSDNSNFTNFNTSGGSALSQWGTNDLDGVSAEAGIEVALSLAGLGVSPGDTIKVATLFMGGTSGTNRWSSNESYGKSISGGDGFSPVTLIGAEVQLGGVNQTLPPDTYPGFSDDDVMLQGFYWNTTPIGSWWNIIASLSTNIASAGFTMVWLPPPYKGANQDESVGYDPFDHYDLGEYNQGSGFERTRYGTKAELATALSSLAASNVMRICDIVPNHMAGGSGGDFKTYDYPHNTWEKSTTDFHPSAAGHNDELYPYHFNWKFGSTNAPDDHPFDVAFLSPNMRLGSKVWGSWLVESNNFNGFRFDFTEGVEPWVIWEWMNYPAQRPHFAFMEYWELSTGEEMQQWLNLTGRRAAIYDSHLRELLKEMCEGNGAFDMTKLESPSLLGLEPAHTVVFIDNHDTMRCCSDFDTNNIPTKTGITTNKPLAYAYAFHSQGLPMVFWREYFDQAYVNVAPFGGLTGGDIKDEINRLIRIRKVAVSGDLSVLHADSDLYIQQRAGGSKYGSVLVMNDSLSSSNISVQTQWASTTLVDLVDTNSPDQVTTDGSGFATLGAPAQRYRIYAPTNALNEVNN